MKKMINSRIVAVMVLAVSMLTLGSCDKESIIDKSALPAKAQDYLDTHFQSVPVIQVVKDVDGFSKNYDVYLQDGFELEFKRNGDIKSVKSNRQEGLPDSVVPAKILTYVRANYAEQVVISWEIDDAHQEVELSNSLDLKFSKSGDFIRID